MSNFTTDVITRFRMPEVCGTWVLAGTHASMARTAVVSAYKPSTDARNAAQGGAGAWGPPV